MEKTRRGRGATQNPSNPYEEISVEYSVEYEEDKPSPKTKFFRDLSKTVLTSNDSPDLGFNYSVNPYRGCEHGCAYCYARPTHEFLGFSAGLDFESKIFVKEKAPQLLRKRLMDEKWKPEPIIFSGVTDCYQPAERLFKLTRQCLEVLLEFKNPAVIITKNALVCRDIDLLQEFQKFRGINVILSVTSLDSEFASILEPRTSRPQARLEAIEALARAGINVGVNVAPIIPCLNEHEIPQILEATSSRGAKFSAYTIVRLPGTVASVFTSWLETHYPDRKQKVLNHIRSMKGGRLNDSRFGYRMKGQGAYAEQIRKLFSIYSKKYGLNKADYNLNSSEFARPTTQLSLL